MPARKNSGESKILLHLKSLLGMNNTTAVKSIHHVRFCEYNCFVNVLSPKSKCTDLSAKTKAVRHSNGRLEENIISI